MRLRENSSARFFNLDAATQNRRHTTAQTEDAKLGFALARSRVNNLHTIPSRQVIVTEAAHGFVVS